AVTFGDLERCIDELNRLVCKYRTLFGEGGMSTLEPTILFDWKDIFSVPLDARARHSRRHGSGDPQIKYLRPCALRANHGCPRRKREKKKEEKEEGRKREEKEDAARFGTYPESEEEGGLPPGTQDRSAPGPSPGKADGAGQDEERQCETKSAR